MIFTRFALRLASGTLICLTALYIYMIYHAVSYKTIMTLTTGKRYIVHPDLLLSSGLGKGDIGKTITLNHYALLYPAHKTVASATSLQNSELVLGIRLSDGSTCAYQRSLALRHQVINDKIEAHPILITLCPFTDTATCFIPVLHGDVISFGVSGMVYLGSLVLYDQLTHSYWSAFDGRALLGPMSGYCLSQVPVMIMPWQAWRSLYPETLVVYDQDEDNTDYAFDPYCKLYLHPEHNLYGTFFVDYRLPPATPIIGIVIDQEPVAYPVEKICTLGRVQDVMSKTTVLISSQGIPYTQGSYPLAVFKKSLAGETLSQLPITCTTWFTWSLFYPNTRVYQ